jgi:anti-sigma B factor antagonist
MILNLQKRESGDVTILELEGRILVGESSQKFHEEVRAIIAGGARKLVLQLGGVTYIDSSGVGEIVGALTATKAAGGELRLADLAPKVRDLMQMTNLNKLFELNYTEAAAVAALK